MFFGTVVKPGRPSPLVPHADGHVLHLSQAALAADAPPKSRVSLRVHLEGEREPVVLCTLCAGVQDTVLLDQFVGEYVELSVVGGAPVHLTGYFSPEFGPEDDEEEDDEEGEDADFAVRGQHPMERLMYGMAAGHDEDESGDEDEDDSMDESEDEDEEGESGSDDSDDLLGAREPSVIIEDITEQEHAKEAAAKAAAGMANGAGPKDSKKRKALPAPEPEPAKKAAVAAGKQQPQTQPQTQPKQQQKQTPQQQQQQQHKKQEKQDQPQQQKQQQKQQQPAKTPDSKAAPASPTPGSASAAKKSVKRYDNGFEVHHTKMGEPHGKLAKGGKVVKVRYVGRLKSNGKVFDQTKAKPFSFRLGVGEVIKGWDRGVEGMRVGDKRKLIIPPQMGYGSQNMGVIPPNSWLEFDVELVDVK